MCHPPQQNRDPVQLLKAFCCYDRAKLAKETSGDRETMVVMMAVMMAMVMANVLDAADEASLPPAAALSGRGHVW